MNKVLLTNAQTENRLTESTAAVPNEASNFSVANNSETYHHRKSMQSAYKDLFQALLKLPDAAVQQRVLDAVNGKNRCSKCSKVKNSVDASTQTPHSFTSVSSTLNEQIDSRSNSKTTSDVGLEKLPCQVNMDDIIGLSMDTLCPLYKDNTVQQRKRRRRKICLPQVIKKSQIQETKHQFHSNPKKRKEDVLIVPMLLEKRGCNGGVDQAAISFLHLHFLEELRDLYILQCKTMSSTEYIKQTMAIEFVRSEEMKDGLLPIHEAVINNDLYSLGRQLFVWKVMKYANLNELLTETDEDCLQLSIVNNCTTKIIQILLESGLNSSCTDGNSNTVIHLALLNEIDLSSLALLLRRIDYTILLKLNDDGYTPLHLAVRCDLYLHAEMLLNMIDNRSMGYISYKRDAYPAEIPKKEFREYYETACERLGEQFIDGTKTSLKRSLLESGEKKSGNTALFFSLENKMEHFIYLLLAHLTDPRIENYNGQDATSYFGEYGKVLNSGIKIYKVMENVVKLIA